MYSVHSQCLPAKTTGTNLGLLFIVTGDNIHHGKHEVYQ